MSNLSVPGTVLLSFQVRAHLFRIKYYDYNLHFSDRELEAETSYRKVA